MKDADRLDRVRLHPNHIHSRIGLDISRVTSVESDKEKEELGNLALESYKSLLEVLNNEQELRAQRQKNKFLKQIVQKSTSQRGLQNIKELVSRIKLDITRKLGKGKDYIEK